MDKNQLIDFGINVFNNEEEKFQRWLKKPNISIGGKILGELLETVEG